MDEDLEAPHSLFYSSDFDSACSTPYVSAPSSPGRSSSVGGGGGGYFYSAPTSPMHFFLISSKQPNKPSSSTEPPSFSSNSEFEFSARFSGEPSPAVSSADELFLNGQIRPMKLKSHLLNPQKLAPLIDLDEPESESAMRENARGREGKPSRRRTRSMSPLRKSMTWHRIKKEEVDGDDINVDNIDKCGIKEEEDEDEEEVVASMSASSSRSSSGGRNSKRWIFLKEFLYRSKSEGRNNNNNNNNNSNGTNSSSKIWSKFSFSPVKAKKAEEVAVPVSSHSTDSLSTMAAKEKESVPVKKKVGPTNGVGKRRVHLSAHEMHYKANRAQSEEMRKKTFLPYRQGLIGCLGFSSKGYGAVNGLARALNPVSSR